ncbi:MAG: BACON domain-containing protein [Lentimicrobiaceae bacterium]|nr:BACON domain-containing protein [Lentimicrobiaceae bacterium]
MRKLCFILLAICLAGTACKKPEKAFLTVDETPIAVTAAGGEYFIKVKSNAAWTAMVKDAENRVWCILNNNNGIDDGTIIVNVAQNTDSLVRSAVVKIISGELVKSVVVNQAEAVVGEELFLIVDETPIMVTAAGGEYSIKVKSNVSWTATVEDAENQHWCILSNNSGTGDGTIIVNVAQNTDSLMRNAVVKITSGELMKSVIINQAGSGEPFLTIQERFIMMKSVSDEYSITVKSNREWSAVVENAVNKNWCTLSNSNGIGNGKITVKVAQNADALMRGAFVKIVSGELTHSVFICQNVKVSGNETTCDWDYPVKPGTPEWIALGSTAARIDTCQIPDNILNSLSTACLTKISLQYPFILDMIAAFNSLRDGFDNFFEKFNGIRELYNREKALNKLLKEYHSLINDMSILDGTASSTQKLDFSFSISVLEVLLYGYVQKVDASAEDCKNILLYLTVGYEKKLKYVNDYYFQSTGFRTNSFARANVIVKTKPESAASFPYALYGSRGPSVQVQQEEDIINELSYEILK